MSKYTIEKRGDSWRVLSEGGDIIGDFPSRAKAERVLELLNPVPKYLIEKDPINGGWRVVVDDESRTLVVGGLHSGEIAKNYIRGLKEGRVDKTALADSEMTRSLFKAAFNRTDLSQKAIEVEFEGKLPLPYKVALDFADALLGAICGLTHEVARLANHIENESKVKL